MKGIMVVVMGLAISGCATEARRAAGDFVYEDLSQMGRPGVKASSASAGKEFEAHGMCQAGDQRYIITQANTALYGTDAAKWVTYLGGQKMGSTSASYEDAASFKAALSSLEMVKPGSLFSEEQRIKVANSQMLQVPTICESMKKKQAIEITQANERQREEDESLNAGVTERTGIEPMFSGNNRMPLNGLASMSLRGDISPHNGKFFWAEAGDYETVQVMDGMVVMVSRLSPGYPAVLIKMNTTPEPGKSHFTTLEKPLVLLGMSLYETVSGLRKPALIFEEI